MGSNDGGKRKDNQSFVIENVESHSPCAVLSMYKQENEF